MIILNEDQNSNFLFFDSLSKFTEKFLKLNHLFAEIVHKCLPSGKHLESSLETLLRSFEVRRKNTSEAFQVVVSHSMMDYEKRMSPDERHKIRVFSEVLFHELKMMVGLTTDYFNRLEAKSSNILDIMNTSGYVRALVGESFHMLSILKYKKIKVEERLRSYYPAKEISVDSVKQWLDDFSGLVSIIPSLIPIDIDPEKIGNLK